MHTAHQHHNEDEHLPTRVLAELRHEVEALKKKISHPEAKMQELILEIESMKESVHELTTVFKKALEETKEQDFSKMLMGVQDSLQKVLGQNETIARGMVALSDKLEETPQKLSSPMPGMARHSLDLPPSMGPVRMAPRPMASMLERSAEELPPPPKMMEKKRVISEAFKE